MLPFNPLKFIKDPQQHSHYQCAICYELTDNPVRCKGPCQQAYCRKCASLVQAESSKCPLRCCDNFQVESIPDIDIKFNCPFKDTPCVAQLSSREEFRLHVSKCQSASEKFKIEKSKIKLFQCSEGHQLLYVNKYLFEQVFHQDSYQNIAHQTCISCN